MAIQKNVKDFNSVNLINLDNDSILSIQNNELVRLNGSNSIITGINEIFVNKIIAKSGVFEFIDNEINLDLALTGSILDNKINILSGNNYLTTSNASTTYATITNLASTGSILQTQVNSLYSSGFITGVDLSSYVTKTNGEFNNRPTVNGTGILLSGEVAALPNTIVYTTGNQTISGNKTFVNNLEVQGTGIFSSIDLSNISQFSFSATNIDLVNSNVYLSGGNVYISGNPVLTGVNLSSYATITNLASTGSTLDNKINALSGNNYLTISSASTTYATITNLASTGSILQTQVNSLSGISVLTFGNQIISGDKTFTNNISVSGTGVFNAIDLNNIDNLYLSGLDISIVNSLIIISGNRPTVNGTGILLSGEVAALPNTIVYTTGNQDIAGIKTFSNTGIFNSGIDLNNSKLVNAVPELIIETSNFFISGNDNGRMVFVNASSIVTGTIVSGNSIGFNTSIIQMNSGQVQITGLDNGIVINSFNNQYKTAGQFATISIFHTGNNNYIMYGNTAT